MIGESYLSETLRPVIEEVINSADKIPES